MSKDDLLILIHDCATYRMKLPNRNMLDRKTNLDIAMIDFWKRYKLSTKTGTKILGDDLPYCFSMPHVDEYIRLREKYNRKAEEVMDCDSRNPKFRSIQNEEYELHRECLALRRILGVELEPSEIEDEDDMFKCLQFVDKIYN